MRFFALNQNPLNLIERDIILGAVVKFGGARGFMGGYRLGVLNHAPASKYAVIPVALNVWQQIRSGRAAAFARNLTNLRASPPHERSLKFGLLGVKGRPEEVSFLFYPSDTGRLFLV
jgi:hypothetical protein